MHAVHCLRVWRVTLYLRTNPRPQAAQLKQELEVLGKSERHAQFKRSMTLVPGAGAGGAAGGGADGE